MDACALLRLRQDGLRSRLAAGDRDTDQGERAAGVGELAAWYSAADLVAVPSYNESFGLVAVEAQACATPVVAAAVGGLTTVVADGHSGLLVDTHRPADWADALARLVHDPDLRARLSTGAVHQASQFSWDLTADKTLETYARARSYMREAVA